MNRKTKSCGFSLVELVIVVVIIGVIAAIAVPRISRGAKGAGESALRADLAAMRNAIDLYAAEHTGDFPDLPEANFVAQLTTFTDDSGGTSATKDSDFRYGPYLRAIPPLPVAGDAALLGGEKGDAGVGVADALGVGWLYTAINGAIVANTGTAEDDALTRYSAY